MLLQNLHPSTWISHVPCCLHAVCTLFMLLTWDTHIKGQKRHTSTLENHVNCEMPRHPPGDSMLGRPAAKSCKIDVESHVNVCFLGSWKYGIPISAVKGGGRFCRFRGFGYMEFPCRNLQNQRRHGIPM